MRCNVLFIALLLALLSLPAFGDTLTTAQTLQLEGILLQYENNEMKLSDELKVLNQNLENLYTESESLKKQTSELKTSLTISQYRVGALLLGLTTMGESIEALETSLRNMERRNKIYKYGIVAAAAVILVETLILIGQ